VIAYALGAMTLATILAGTLPALTDSRLRSGLVLRTAGLLESARGARRWMAGLVVFETALSVTLLVGALLLVRSAVAIYGERPGFDVESTLAFHLRMDASHPEPGVREATLRRLRDELGALPGVDAVGAANILPFSGGLWNTTFWWDEESRAARARADLRVVTPGYFEAMGTRLVAGRDFTEAEPATSVIVDEFLARQAWPGQNPVGRILQVRGAEHPFTVVGVTEHIRVASLHEDGRPALYFTYGFRPRTTFGVVLHTSLPPASLVNTVRQVVSSVDPTLSPYRIAPLRESALRSVSTTRYVVLLLSGFALAALVLAVVGLYAVIAYGVRLRFRELGIRMALGATRSGVFTRVVVEAVVLAAVGLGLGWGAALGMSEFLDSLLYGVAPTDPATFVGTGVVLLGAAAVAGGIPAWRAMRIDPNAILKVDA
jgi:predicted permease